MRKINAGVDWFNNQIESFSVWRYHILIMFVGLGGYLVVLPLLHLITVSLDMEATLGNYTNVISAGVSLLTLAEAKRITEQNKKTHRHLGIKSRHRRHIDGVCHDHCCAVLK